MATSTSISLPELQGMTSKRRSLGQLKLRLDQVIDFAKCYCRMADPSGDGRGANSHSVMLKTLEKSNVDLQVAFEKWSLRLNQCIEEDTSDDNQKDYAEKWKKVKTEFLDTKNLLVTTLSHILPKISPGPSQNATQASQITPIKPIESLKPFQLELETSPSKFRDWKKRFESFFDASNLKSAAVVIQQTYFRQCLNEGLSNILDSKITDDLPVFCINPDDDSCLKLLEEEIETRNPLTLTRLALFNAQQGKRQSFKDYVAHMQKLQESADLANFTPDAMMGFLLLAGLKDSEILEEILKKSPAPDFNEMVKIGKAIELRRDLMTKMNQGENKGSVLAVRKDKQCYKCHEWGHIKKHCRQIKEKDHESSDDSSDSCREDESESSDYSENFDREGKIRKIKEKFSSSELESKTGNDQENSNDKIEQEYGTYVNQAKINQVKSVMDYLDLD